MHEFPPKSQAPPPGPSRFEVGPPMLLRAHPVITSVVLKAEGKFLVFIASGHRWQYYLCCCNVS